MESKTTEHSQTPVLAFEVSGEVERQLDSIFRLLADRGRRIRVQASSLAEQAAQDAEQQDVCPSEPALA